MGSNRQAARSGPIGIWRRLGAGTQVVILVTLAFLPLLALHGYSVTQIVAEQRLHLEHDVEDLSEAASLVVEGTVNAARQTAAALSEVAAIRTPDPPVATRTLARIQDQNPAYVSLWAAGPDGFVYATGLPGAAGTGTSIGGEPYFQLARQRLQPVVTTTRSVPGLPGVFTSLVAAPVLLDSQFNGTVQVAFSLLPLEMLPTHVGLPPEAETTVIDGQGTVIFRSLQPERWVGVNIADLPIFRQIQTATGAFVAPGLDGIVRLLAVATVPGTDWRAIVGLPAAEALGPLNATLNREIVLFVLTVVIAGVLAWRGKVLADQVEDERRRLAGTLEQLPEGVLVTTPGGRVLQANRALEAIVGGTVARGMGYREQLERTGTWLQNDREAAWEELPFERARRGEAVRGAQVGLQCADGSRRDLLINAMPLRAPGGDIEEVVAVVADVTVLKDLDRAKDEFISIAAHELRNPLAGLKGYTELLLRQAQRKGYDEETVRMLAATEQQADRLTAMTSRLLDVSRLQLGRLELVRQRTDLVALAREVAESLQLTTDMHQIIVDAEPAEIAGHWDADRLRQVLNNFVGNAIKYAPGGRITILVRQEDRQADLLVSDQGPGIAPDQLPHLFERFRQAGRTERERAGGLGLGLYLAKGIVEAHGGRIGVESQPGRGSTFWFTLPLLRGASSREPAPEVLAQARAASRAPA